MGEAKSRKSDKQRKSRRRRKEQILTNTLLYSITAALTCASFCSTPHLLIYTPPPTLFCCLKLFISLSIPPLTSVFLSPRFLFIIGNLIVLFLVGSFNTDAGDCNRRDPSNNHYRPSTFTDLPPSLDNSETEERDIDDGDDDGERTEEEETVELNKRAADFIARVNYQIRFESAFIK